MARSVAADDQPGAEGQHRHRATQGEQISGIFHLKANRLLECRDDQPNDNHVGEIVLQALQAVHRKDVGVLLGLSLVTGIKV